MYVSFLDQLPPQGDGPSFNGLDERRRGPLFQAALRAASEAGELPPVVIINRDIDLPSTVRDEKPLPPGATLVRVYLTQWSSTRLGGFSDSEILCRVFVEIVRDGKTVSKHGPYLGRLVFDLTSATTAEDRFIQFQEAARLAVDEMARDLPHGVARARS